MKNFIMMAVNVLLLKLLLLLLVLDHHHNTKVIVFAIEYENDDNPDYKTDNNALLPNTELNKEDNDNNDKSSSSMLHIPLRQLFTTQLSTTNIDNNNDNRFPLIGLGVGNLQYDKVTNMIQNALYQYDINLYDTSHASHNEDAIRRGIDEAIMKSNKSKSNSTTIVHVVTKVWYTHLGYNRTILSVKESLNELSNSKITSTADHDLDIRVHILIHWPRCRNDIEWMDCIGDEKELQQYIKDVDPNPPTYDSYLDSWKALEDLYIEHNPTNSITTNNNEGEMRKLRSSSSSASSRSGSNTNSGSNNENNNTNNNIKIRISSIGISNFDTNDLKKLLIISRIKPHIIQMNVWSYMYDPILIQLCNDSKIHIQVYNVMNGIINQFHKAEIAWNNIQHLSRQFQFEYNTNHHHKHMKHINDNSIQKKKKKRHVISTQYDMSLDDPHTATIHLILSYFIYHKVSIIPRTSNVEHLKENSMYHNLNKYVELWHMMDTEQIHKLYQQKHNSTTSNNNNKDDIIVSLPILLKSPLFSNDEVEDQNNIHNDILMERLFNRKNTVANCIRALLSGIDVIPVQVTFDNTIPNAQYLLDNPEFDIQTNMKRWYIYIVYTYRNNQKLLIQPMEGIGINETSITQSYPGYDFIARTCTDWNDKTCSEIHYEVTVQYGQEQIFQLPKFDNDELEDNIFEEL